MDAEKLSRIQFALTASFHFIFPPLSMGLGLMLVAIAIKYVRSGDPKWRQLQFFWTQVYGLIFAMGIATGIVQEFEFGTNWSAYSRFVGNIFGSLLAAEGIFAFLLEGGFLGLMLFGGNRLGPRMWLAATSIVVFAAHFSALWIIMANSWMQTPQGYEVVNSPAPARAVMTDFTQVMFTPSFLPRIFHVFFASWTAGSALVLSVCAYYILRKRHVDLAKANFSLALPFFVTFAILNFIAAGPRQAIEVTDHQQAKLAAIEGVFDDQSCAPLYIVGWVNESEQKVTGLSVPCLLSLLSYRSKDATVTGLNSFPQDDWAPVNLAFQVYHLMFNLAMFFGLMAVLGVALYFWKRRIFTWRWVLWLFVINVGLAEVAIITGWWTAEIGRQPWVVWNVLRTEDAVSPTLTTTQAWFSVVMFVVLYSLLLVLFLYLLNAKIKHGPEPLEDVETVEVGSLPNTVREIFRSHGPRASGDAMLEPAHPAEVGEVTP